MVFTRELIGYFVIAGAFYYGLSSVMPSVVMGVEQQRAAAEAEMALNKRVAEVWLPWRKEEELESFILDQHPIYQRGYLRAPCVFVRSIAVLFLPGASCT